MAIVTCPDCQKPVSSEAAQCIHCGRPMVAPAKPPRKPIGCGTGLVLLIVLAVVGSMIRSSLEPRAPTKSVDKMPAKTVKAMPAPPPTPVDPKLHAKREQLLKELREGGVITVVECRQKGATLGVTPLFMAATFEQKASFAGVVWAYCFEGTPDWGVVRLIDSRNRKKVGDFIPGRLDID